MDGSPASCCAPLPEINVVYFHRPLESADGRRAAVRTGTSRLCTVFPEGERVTPMSAKAAVTSVHTQETRVSGTPKQDVKMGRGEGGSQRCTMTRNRARSSASNFPLGKVACEASDWHGRHG